MDKLILFLSTFSCFVNTFGQTPATAIKSLKLYSCETGLIYELNSHEIALEGTWFVPSDTSNTFMRTKIAKADRELFRIISNDFLTKKANEILYNHCVVDGFNFKIYLYTDTVVKKIFVGNHYDKRVDQLTSLFDKYLMKVGLDATSYKIGYGNKESVGSLIKSQESCTMTASDDYKKHLLDNWCELK